MNKNSHDVHRGRWPQPGEPGQNRRNATCALRNLTRCLASNRNWRRLTCALLRQDVMRTRSTRFRRRSSGDAPTSNVSSSWMRSPMRLESTLGGQSPSTLSVGCITASPERAPDGQRTSEIDRRKQPKLQSHDREPIFDAAERPVGLRLRRAQPLVSPPGTVRSRYPDVGVSRCRSVVACLGEPEADASRAAVRCQTCLHVARSR